MKTLSIINQTIRQHEGLYSLNDLHQASGGEEKHQPSFFLRNGQTQALIEELSSANLQTLKTVTGKGKAQGTYACKELVIAYAAWISAAFHLKVIGVFLDSVQQSKPPLKQLSEASRAFKDVYKLLRVLDIAPNAAAIGANQAIRQQGSLDVLALTGHTHLNAENQDSLSYTPTDLGKPLGLSAIKINQLLEQAGLQHKPFGRWQPTEKGRPHAHLVTTGKAHGEGAPIEQLRWHESAIPFIQPVQQQGAAQ